MLEEDIRLNVESALKEDLGGVLDPSRDISAQVIPADLECEAAVISRESGIFCGEKWVEEILRQLGGKVDITWFTKDGEQIKAGQELLHLKGNARIITTAERTVLNFVQMLSGVATAVQAYVKELEGTSCNLFDTRKSIPGLRSALKYAVACGGGKNHRVGLFDMFFSGTVCFCLERKIILHRLGEPGNIIVGKGCYLFLVENARRGAAAFIVRISPDTFFP